VGQNNQEPKNHNLKILFCLLFAKSDQTSLKFQITHELATSPEPITTLSVKTAQFYDCKTANPLRQYFISIDVLRQIIYQLLVRSGGKFLKKIIKPMFNRFKA